MSVNAMVAYGLWVAAVGMCLIGWDIDSLGLRVLAVIAGLAATTATVRLYLVALGCRIKAALIVAATEQQESTTVRSMR